MQDWMKNTACPVYGDTAPPLQVHGPLQSEIRTKVAVVGGGITGASTALHLAQAGIDCCLLEAREIGWGASGRNGGQVNPGLKYEPSQIEASYGEDLGKRMVALSGSAPQLVFDLIGKHQIDCEARQSGTVRAGFSAGTVAFLKTATADLRARGIPVDYLDRAAMRALTGTDRYEAGALDRRGGALNPLAYVRGLARAALAAGARIYDHSPALSLCSIDGKWYIKTAQGSVIADQVALGTNGYTDDLVPSLRQTLVPVFGGIIASNPLPADLAAKIMSGGQSLYEHESITVYYRLDAQNRLLMGGRSRLRHLDGPSQFPDLQRYSHRLWPEMKQVGWRYGWNGQLAVTTDAYLHLNEPASGLVSSLGYNGRGVAMATAMGGQIALRLAGMPQDALSMPITPLRPIPMHRFWPLGASIRIAYGRFRNRFGI